MELSILEYRELHTFFYFYFTWSITSRRSSRALGSSGSLGVLGGLGGLRGRGWGLVERRRGSLGGDRGNEGGPERVEQRLNKMN